jgi:hypothetical protein
MTEGEKTSKVKDIKETFSLVTEILRLIRTPDGQESFAKIIDASKILKEIIKDLTTPEMVKNIENFRLISENINEASAKMQNTLKQLEETGVINEAKGLLKSAKSTVDLLGDSDTINGQNMQEMSTAIKEMFRSIRSLVDELRITVAYSKKSGTIHNIREAVKEASEAYNAVQMQ